MLGTTVRRTRILFSYEVVDIGEREGRDEEREGRDGGDEERGDVEREENESRKDGENEGQSKMTYKGGEEEKYSLSFFLFEEICKVSKYVPLPNLIIINNE